MRSKLFGIAVSLFLFGAVPIQALPLVDQGSNTYDPNTGLLWLDVPLTANLSYNNVVQNYLSPGGLYAGYRYATGAEASTLFTNAGIANPFFNLTLSPSLVQTYQNFIGLLGSALGNPTPHPIFDYVQGYTAFGPSPSETWVAFVSYEQVEPVLGAFDLSAFAQAIALNRDFANPVFGSFLVLDPVTTPPVPVPAALPLFASGMGVLYLLARRRKRVAMAVPSH